jgi:hypothetical protein
MASDLWRFSTGKMLSVSAAAILKGPVIAASSASSTKDWVCMSVKMVDHGERESTHWMSSVSDINSLALGLVSHDIFRAETISHTANFLDSLSLQEFDTLLGYSIDFFGRMGVVASSALCHPCYIMCQPEPGCFSVASPVTGSRLTHKVEIGSLVQWKRVAIEQINQERVVSIRGKLVCDQLRVFPDANYVR